MASAKGHRRGEVEGSEYGRGYATCLLQFTFHAPRLEEFLGSATLGPGEAVELWMNGASDHLAGLERPPAGISDEEWAQASALRSRALDIGHGYRAQSASTPSEAASLLRTAADLLKKLETTSDWSLELAMRVDEMFGLAPDPGMWSCPQPLRNELVP